MHLKSTSFALLTLLVCTSSTAASSLSNGDVHRSNQLNVDNAADLNNLGNLYFYQGKYKLALQTYQQCQNLRNKQQSPSYFECAATLHNIGLVYHKLGQYDEALFNYKDSCKIYESLQQNNHVDYATVLTNMAFIYQKKGDYDKALQAYEQSRKIYQSKLTEMDPNFPKILNTIAIFHYNQGSFDKSLQVYQLSEKASLKQLSKYHLNHAIVLNSMHACRMQKLEKDVVQRTVKTERNNAQSKPVSQAPPINTFQTPPITPTATGLLALSLVLKKKNAS